MVAVVVVVAIYSSNSSVMKLTELLMVQYIQM